RKKGIPVGPGRGSGAGSLVAYSLHITDLDPMHYGLLFERFLNPERVSMPDFDIDFCMHRRDEVIEYVSGKYGRDNVGQIVTMHQLKARGVTRDVARVMGLSYAEGDRVAKLIPEPIQGRSVTVPEALEQEPRLRELADENPKIAELLEVAAALEGLNRHASTHAAGVVIGEKPLWEHVPCFRGQNGELVTQFAMKEVEQIGLVKFDFLGLKTLTVLDCAQKNINRGGKKIKLDSLPMDDEETLRMIQNGDTVGVFQMESTGFKELLKKLKPDRFEDLIAAVALYRPGPLKGGMVDDFIDRKHGRKSVDYLHPWLEPVLKETYGVIVYQEQVMQIASILAGFELGQADILRRAMGKKNAEEMAKQKAIFLEGAAKKSVDLKLAENIFVLVEKFAEYGFNKSHSAAYAYIAYQTAYLKCHFPAEFMAAVLTCDKDNSDNLAKFITETRNMGIQVLRPDINESEADFSVIEKDNIKYIRFGLGAIRNVGEGAAETILEARKEQPFDGLYEFCERVDGRRVNRRVIESLIKSGAFDTSAEKQNLNRAQLMEALDLAQERATNAQRDRETGQTNLFGMLEPETTSAVLEKHEDFPDIPDWEPKRKLAFEKESLGFYVSGHPLDRYADDLRRYASVDISGLFGLPEHSEVTVGGLVGDYRERPLRSGRGRMAIFNLEDQTAQIEVVVFSRPFEEFEAILKSDEPLMVNARIKLEGEGENVLPRLYFTSAVTLPALRRQKATRLVIKLDADRADPAQMKELKEILLQHVGECKTHIVLSIPDRSTTQFALSERFSVTPSDELLVKIERLFGGRVAVFK
ncbi:MAG: DNA polymerase III subunit alpha, partial [Pseudomonadota bacterium]